MTVLNWAIVGDDVAEFPVVNILSLESGNLCDNIDICWRCCEDRNAGDNGTVDVHD